MKENTLFIRFSLSVWMVILLSGCAEELVLCPDENHPHAIDLGLPNGTKWACCNLGAPSPEHSGGYYAWGETSVKSSYDSGNFEGPTRVEDIAGTEYDAAYVNMGRDWRIPSFEQVSELLNYCKDQEGRTYNGVKGFLFTGPSGNSIFFPFSGYMYGNEIHAEFQGYVWTSTRDNPYEDYVVTQSRVLKYNKKRAFTEISPMEWGHNIRPVIKK